MIRALYKFANNPYGGYEIDTTSNSGAFRDLSPFVLPIINTPLISSENFENLWQFSKVYKLHLGPDGNPSTEWYNWHAMGLEDKRAHRYPMGKGAIPEYSFWFGEKLGYIEARKRIYASVYSENVIHTNAFDKLSHQYQQCLRNDQTLILRDYDAYDHIALNMSLVDVINNPKRKMGHAFVLVMMLTDTLEKCINSR